MPCFRVPMPNGGYAWVRGSTRRLRCSACGLGGRADRECDWKLGDGKTCDRLLCARCTSSPAPDKDLCPEHALAWKRWKVAHAVKRGAGGEAPL